MVSKFCTRAIEDAARRELQIATIFGKSAQAICAHALNLGFIRACYVMRQLRDRQIANGDHVERDG
jgi:hypothetical protein